MPVFTTTEGQTDLPRYFAAVFNIVKTIDKGRIDFRLPDDRIFRAQGPDEGGSVELVVHNVDCFARLIREGDLGFSDAYLDGWWSTDDLQAFMDILIGGNTKVFEGFPGMSLVRFYERMRHWMNQNSKGQATKNISYHYDLGNAFYSEWLDETMTYSSALFDEETGDLAEAQTRKYKALVDRLDVKPGDHVLEIGCGWGGFAEYAAAERGLKVTGLTISQEQHDYAVERMKNAGLSDMVEIVMRDYRDEAGLYDGVASIEMFEAVGEKYWPQYFGVVHKCLKPGRSAALQIITIANERFERYRNRVDFLQKYIFPGGMLPSPDALMAQIRAAGFTYKGSVEFGQSYSKTLRHWHDVFNAKWDKIRGMGFDDRFHRMWNFYLTCCAASFRSGNCDVTQISMTRQK